MRRIVFIVIIVLAGSALRSQDMHFSQIYMSPLSLSPMQTGNFEGDWRFSNNYRTQWRAVAIPYNTISAGFEKQFLIRKQHCAGGIYILNDKSGHVFLDVTKIFLSFAWHKKSGLNNFHFGLQGGYVHKAFDVNSAVFPSQYDVNSGMYNNSLITGETNLGEVTGYPDANFAMGWSRRTSRFEPEIAISLFHLTMPKETFFSENNKLPIREVFSGRLKMFLGEKVVVTPTVFAMGQRNAADIIGGARFDYFFRPVPTFFKGIFVGGYFRTTPENQDAGIIQGGLSFKRFELGVAYDLNISSLKVATGSRGAFEIALIYTGASTMLNKLTIPCERM